MGYYRKFFRNFQNKAEPLYNLLKKGQKFIWSEECEKAFSNLKNELMAHTLLSYPDFQKEFILQCDASNVGIGYVLSQKKDDIEMPISMSGRTLTPAERNWSVFEQEGLALVCGIKHFKSYLINTKFIVETDHKSLIWLLNIKEPKSRIARWQIFLSQFDFEIKHKKGKLNANADGLSRLVQINAIQTNQITELQHRDETLRPLIYYLKNQDIDPSDITPKVTILEATNYFLEEDGTLYHIQKHQGGNMKTYIQMVIPKSLISEILHWFHESPVTGTHLGITKTYDKISRKYFWKGLYNDVKFYVKSCASCGTRKHPANKQKAPLIPFPTCEPWSRIHIDLHGPMPAARTSGHRFILCAIDAFTKYAIIRSTLSIEANVICQMVYDDIITKYGALNTILTDRGGQFCSDVFRQLCNIVNTTALTTTAYSPNVNGNVERLNRTLDDSLAMYVSTHNENWDLFLSGFSFAYNTSIHPSIKETPFFMVFGREPRTPVDVSLLPEKKQIKTRSYITTLVENLKTAHSNARYFIQKAARDMKEKYDRHTKEVKFQTGDKVYLYNPPTTKAERKTRRFQHKYHGPFRLGEQTSPVNFRLMTLENKPLNDIVHVNRLKRFIDVMEGPDYFKPQEEDEILHEINEENEEKNEQIIENQTREIEEKQTETTKEPLRKRQIKIPNKKLRWKKSLRKVRSHRKARALKKILIRMKMKTSFKQKKLLDIESKIMKSNI